MDGKNAYTAIVILMGMCTLCPSAMADDVDLGGRYVDPINGFSIRAPLGTERTKDPSPSRLVTWSCRDEKTKAVLWKLTVVRAVETNKNIRIKPYAKALADKLRTEENYKIDTVELTSVADRPVIDLRGVTGGVPGFWRRQVWVLARPGEFLIFIFTGPKTIAKELDAICDTMLATLEITDPKAGEARRQENMKNGRELLAGISDEQMAAAIVTQPRWYLLKLKDKNVGFTRTIETAATRQGAKGYEVITWVMFQQAKTERRFGRRAMFTTADRKLERWNETLLTGEGRNTRRDSEEGMKQAKMIVCYVSPNGGSMQTHKKTLNPPVIRAIYLPRAMGAILPRLVDLKKPATYAFAVYNSSTNDFDMRTFTVVGPQQIDLQARTLSAIRITDRMAADAEVATLWVDGDGVLLRMKTTDGLVMDQSTRTGILRRFPGAQSQIDQSNPKP